MYRYLCNNSSETLKNLILQQESEGNGVPSLTLPSISEDDENLQEGDTSPVSPNRSPLHQITNSPRHAKFNLRSVYNNMYFKILSSLK